MYIFSKPVVDYMNGVVSHQNVRKLSIITLILGSSDCALKTAKWSACLRGFYLALAAF